MLTFDPPEVETNLRATLLKFTDALTVLLDGEEIAHDFALDAFADAIVTDSSEVVVGFPYCDTDASLSIGEFIELSNEVTDPKTSFDGLTFHSRTRTVLRVMSWDLRSIAFAEKATERGELGAATIAELPGVSVRVGLRGASPHYGAAVVLKDNFYDKYHPPLMPDDIFIEAIHPQGADQDAAMAIIQSYLFELETSLGLEYFEAPRPSEEAEYPEDEEIDALAARAAGLRPLLVGHGMHVLLQEFNRGHGAMNRDATLLSYVKCIEYVSATVVREKQYEDLRKRLLSRDALNPNADYLDGLLTLFEENRVLTRDAEALKLSVERCCDVLPMASHAPRYLRLLAAVTPKSSADDRRNALSELAAALSASRNQLAHAKANYKITGKECPPDQVDRLVACAKIAAEQCIRWYASRSPELRRS
ncbi:MAG TPA: hypothetical protein PKE27_15015 [Povalibacter sp.]|uniref:hypothetical protein n=1 Tax=Povalibacter sp. TaxID=1962978 RepID=UPI002C574E6B|nr:hypothetical protein [Povalibacter sp.]HMN45887.1 hypothetical protein [Povalibacter sp.]